MWKKVVNWLKHYIKERNWIIFALFVLFAALLWWGYTTRKQKEAANTEMHQPAPTPSNTPAK